MRRRLVLLAAGAALGAGAVAWGGAASASGAGAPSVRSGTTGELRTTSELVNTTRISAMSRANPRTVYERKMQALGSWLNGQLFAMGTADRQTGATAAGDAFNLANGRSALRQAAKDLGKIVPPTNIRGAHELLRQAVLEYANELTTFIVAARKGTVPDPRKILRLKGLKDMTSASLAIEKKGYNITGSSGP